MSFTILITTILGINILLYSYLLIDKVRDNGQTKESVREVRFDIKELGEDVDGGLFKIVVRLCNNEIYRYEGVSDYGVRNQRAIDPAALFVVIKPGEEEDVPHAVFLLEDIKEIYKLYGGN